VTVTAMITIMVLVLVAVPPPFFPPSLMSAVAIMSGVHVMLGIAALEIALFISAPPSVPAMIAIPVPVGVAKRCVSERDAEIHGGNGRRCRNDRRRRHCERKQSA